MIIVETAIHRVSSFNQTVLGVMLFVVVEAMKDWELDVEDTKVIGRYRD